jgi:L-2,4-diaminobutyric acid acetyltransferase
VHALIADSPPLDTNSIYCNLLQCTHWSSTSVLAEHDGRVVGFISAYVIPERPDTVFVWQVAVAAEARGTGLGGRMLDAVLEREACAHVQHLETTITADNAASWGLFRSLARRHDAALDHSELFTRERHFAGHHASEILVRVGPFAAAGAQDLRQTRKTA